MYPIIFCNIDMFAQDAHIYKLTEKGVEDLGNCQIEEAITIAPQFCY